MDADTKAAQCSICILEEQSQLTLDDLCGACAVETERIMALVEVGVLEPQGQEPECWIFSGESLHRARKALRLQHDLDIDLTGLALVLDLLDEIDSLRIRLRAMGNE